MLSGCKKYPIGPLPESNDNTPLSTTGKGVFVICEGNYGWKNSSVSYINNETFKISNSIIFNSQNSLGDIAQSMIIIDSLGFIAVNNSDKVEAININSMKRIKSITGIISPRYMIKISNEKVIASSLYSNYIYVISLKDLSVSGKIYVGCTTEKLFKYNNKIFATNWSMGNKIAIVDIESESLERYIYTGKEPSNIVLDKDKKIWVLCSGGYDNSDFAKLLKINPENYFIEKVFTFPDKFQRPSELTISKNKDSLYYICGSVFCMNISSTELPASPLISSHGKNFYGLDADSLSGTIYLSDAKNYISQGIIYTFRSNGIPQDTFIAGVNPGDFCFK